MHRKEEVTNELPINNNTLFSKHTTYKIHLSELLSGTLFEMNKELRSYLATLRYTKQVECMKDFRRDRMGHTLLHLAVHGKDIKRLEKIKQEVNSQIWKLLVNDLSYNGHTPLMIAIIREHADVVRWLLANEALVDASGLNGTTPLMSSMEYNDNAAIVLMLLEKTRNINAHDTNGNTALMHAASKGFSQSIELILQKNANTMLFNNNGSTALDLAIGGGKFSNKQLCAMRLAYGVVRKAEIEISREGLSARASADITIAAFSLLMLYRLKFVVGEDILLDSLYYTGFVVGTFLIACQLCSIYKPKLTSKAKGAIGCMYYSMLGDASEQEQQNER